MAKSSNSLLIGSLVQSPIWACQGVPVPELLSLLYGSQTASAAAQRSLVQSSAPRHSLDWKPSYWVDSGRIFVHGLRAEDSVRPPRGDRMTLKTAVLFLSEVHWFYEIPTRILTLFPPFQLRQHWWPTSFSDGLNSNWSAIQTYTYVMTSRKACARIAIVTHAQFGIWNCQYNYIIELQKWEISEKMIFSLSSQNIIDKKSQKETFVMNAWLSWGYIQKRWRGEREADGERERERRMRGDGWQWYDKWRDCS